VRPLLRKWLRQSTAKDDVAASALMHCHIALILAGAPALQQTKQQQTQQKQQQQSDASVVHEFMASVAFSLAWHTRTGDYASTRRRRR
jgi:hypothetical protein